MIDRLQRRAARLCLTGAMIVAGTFASTAHAANTVLNPNFNSDLSFWTPFTSGTQDSDPPANGSVTHSATQDVDGQIPASGAAAVVLSNTAAQTKTAIAAHQCVDLGNPAPAIAEANYGARLKVPSTDPSNGSVQISVELRFYSDAGCATFIPGAGGVQGRSIAAGVPDDAFWYTAADAHFIPPPGTVARSAEVRATLRRIAGSETDYTGYFDNVYLSLNGTTPVALQHFQVD